MPVVNVWDSSICKKKTVVADSVRELIDKGVKKCDLQLNEDQLKDVSVVLEECGSEVEDDDVLKEYKDKIFMLLMPGEKWHDVKEDDKQLNNSAAELENTLANTPVVDLISFCV